MRLPVLALALVFSLGTHAQTSTVTVEVDAAQPQSALRDLTGANKKPTFNGQFDGLPFNAASLYKAFGISQVRLHDAGLDLCTTYTAATKVNTGVTPTQPVTGCTLQGSSGRPHFTWTPASSVDADLNNTANYDFTSVDDALSGAIATGAAVYLRLGESYNGPNDTADPIAWAKVATNIYKHVIGTFKPTAGIAVNPVFVEIFNEPDGGFWAGSTSSFNTLFVETAQRVRAAAAEAGRTVKIGGAGFTRNVLANSSVAGNPANGFVAAVGASTLDFYSAHLYNNCANATLSSAANFLRSLRSIVNGQGGSAKPMHITEWNIGLGSQCGNDFFAEPRTQSFGSGVLTLMQDPAQNIEAAHFYAGVPIMALFDFTSVAGKARINPSAWALWAHAQLKGASQLSAQVCPQSGTCVAGYAAESAPVLALAGQSTQGQSVIITNDGSAAVTYTLRIKGLSNATASASISTPPSAVQELPASGSPVTADANALATLLTSVPTETRSGLTVNAGVLELVTTVPARSIQMVKIQSTVTPVLQLAAGWNLVGNGVEASVPVATVFNDASKVNALWKWVNSGWAFYSPAQADGGKAYATSMGYQPLATLNAGDGFWLQAHSAFNLSLPAAAPVLSASFKPHPTGATVGGGSRALPTGWSLIAVGDSPTALQFNVAVSASGTAATTTPAPQNVTSLWAWDAGKQRWAFWSPSLLNDGTLAAFLAQQNYLDLNSLATTPTGTLAPATGVWVQRP